jgi:hypothetical protein
MSKRILVVEDQATLSVPGDVQLKVSGATPRSDQS